MGIDITVAVEKIKREREREISLILVSDRQEIFDAPNDVLFELRMQKL